ncbi:hypothetical protein ABT294_13825 [Nonomuraea sp. NPDC000554]|uniref:hypothetical protein n=1 Tax=Nonomuraea sp. NPDC000554 TaxID=3154259 RepID=UPI00332C1F76
MAKVVVDPEVPQEDADLLRQSEQLLLRTRDGWTADPPPPKSSGRAGRLALVIGALVLIFLMATLGGLVSNAGGALALSLLGVPLAIVALLRRDLDEDDDVVAERAVYEQLRQYEGRYVLAVDLDESSRRLLERAHQAIATVFASRVQAEGLLDGARNAVMLPAQEWEIAKLLAKLSALRSRHRETVSDELAPEVAAVAAPLARALDSSEDAVVARVEALERYAVNVTEAERAYRAHEQVEELRGRLHQYEELVAESGADSFAAPELAALAEDAGQLEQALRRSLSSAHEAFRYLDP